VITENRYFIVSSSFASLPCYERVRSDPTTLAAFPVRRLSLYGGFPCTALSLYGGFPCTAAFRYGGRIRNGP
jgi:hypothetical protein